MLGNDPFLASLRRHRPAAAMIVLQAALSTVLLALALAKAAELHARANRPSGLEEARLVQLVVQGPLDAPGQLRELAALARIRGVAGVSRVNQVPFGAEYWSADLGRHRQAAGGTVRAAVYLGPRDLRRQLGLPLREGRDFLPDEEQAHGLRNATHVQLDAVLAQQLFPDGHAVGRTVHLGAQPLQVVGVYAPLQAPAPDGTPTLIVALDFPAMPATRYLLRLHEARPPPAGAVAAVVRDASPARWVSDYRSFAELREGWFLQDRWIIRGLLLGVALWLVGTGLGLANLADLMLQSRLRQVGLCRALGARNAQICWQLRRENLVLAGAGALAGLALLQLLLHAWPWLAQQLGGGSPAMQALSLALVVLAGQCAMWPVTREAGAIEPAGLLRHA